MCTDQEKKREEAADHLSGCFSSREVREGPGLNLAVVVSLSLFLLQGARRRSRTRRSIEQGTPEAMDRAALSIGSFYVENPL